MLDPWQEQLQVLPQLDCCDQDNGKQFFGCDIQLLGFAMFFPSDLKSAAYPQCPAATLA